jgi:hypothetical protein
MKNYKNTDEGKIYDIYTIKKDVNKDLKNITKKDLKNKGETNEHDYTEVKYKCDDKYSTNPFCTKEYDEKEVLELKKFEENKNYSNCYESSNVLDSYDEQNKLYTSYCKAKFGDEYGFDNSLENNNKNILKCDNPNEIRVKCALNFEGQKLNIEPFANNNMCNGYSSGVNLLILFGLCIFFIIFVLVIIFIYRLVYGYKKINKKSA